MDSQQFDRIARALGSAVSRRTGLLGLGTGALTGIGASFSLTDAKKNKKKCGTCKKRKNGKCRPNLLARCNGRGTCCIRDSCCERGTACTLDGCQECPETPDPCETGLPVCGYFATGKNDWCGCVTSVEGATTCSSLFYDCLDCTTDQQCTDFIGAPAICSDSPCLDCTGTNGRVCLLTGCQDFSAGRATKSRGRAHQLRRLRPA